MRDAFRVYVSGDDGRWKLLTTNNSDRDRPPDDDDGRVRSVLDARPGHGRDWFRSSRSSRGETFDSPTPPPTILAAGPRRPVAVRRPEEPAVAVRLQHGGRHEFRRTQIHAGLEHRRQRIAGHAGRRTARRPDVHADRLRPDPSRHVRQADVGFEFDLGPTIVAPTGTAVDDGDMFTSTARCTSSTTTARGVDQQHPAHPGAVHRPGDRRENWPWRSSRWSRQPARCRPASADLIADEAIRTIRWPRPTPAA